MSSLVTQIRHPEEKAHTSIRGTEPENRVPRPVPEKRVNNPFAARVKVRGISLDNVTIEKKDSTTKSDPIRRWYYADKANPVSERHTKVWRINDSIVAELFPSDELNLEALEREIQMYKTNCKHPFVLLLGSEDPSEELEQWMDTNEYYFCYYPEAYDKIASPRDKMIFLEKEVLRSGVTASYEPAINQGNPDASFWDRPGGLNEQHYEEFLKILGS